jgi:hypothetical protein
MKNIINKSLLMFAAITIIFGACKKKENKQYYNASNAKIAIASSATAVLLTKPNANETVVSFTWNKPDFGYNASVFYTLLFDLPADSFKNTQTSAVGADVLSSGFTVAQINQFATAFKMTPDSTGIIYVRVKAEVKQNGGASIGKSDSLDVIYSDPIELKVTPYSDSIIYPAIYAAGQFQGWDPTKGIPLYSFHSDNKYEGYIYIPGSSASDFEFKFTSLLSWAGPNYGSSATAATTNGFITSGTLSTDGGAGNLSVPAAGYYRMKVDATGLTWEGYQTTSWGLIGDATPGGWNTETPMTYNATDKIWVIETVALTAGSIKFRANNAWDLSYGIDPADPTGVKLTSSSGANIPITVAGNYKVVLDLSNSTTYHCVLTKL